MLAPSSRPVVIERGGLKEAGVVAVMNDEAGGDTTVNIRSINMPQHRSCPGQLLGEKQSQKGGDFFTIFDCVDSVPPK